LKRYPDVWRREVEASLCRSKVASRIWDAVSSAGRSERVRVRREGSRRVKRRRGPPCGKSSWTRELQTNTRRRGERPSRRLRPVAASASTVRLVRGSSIDGVEPPGRSRGGRAADTGGPLRYEALPDGVAEGVHCPPRTYGPLAFGIDLGTGVHRCLPKSRGAASRNRELGPAPSEAREDPAASLSHLPPAARAIRGCESGIAPANPRCGDPRYTRWTANQRRDGSSRCRE